VLDLGELTARAVAPTNKVSQTPSSQLHALMDVWTDGHDAVRTARLSTTSANGNHTPNQCRAGVHRNTDRRGQARGCSQANLCGEPCFVQECRNGTEVEQGCAKGDWARWEEPVSHGSTTFG
jgi:hypothetical protein